MEYTRITLRIPKHLHSMLSKSSEESSKSLNAEIINRITESYAEGGTTNHDLLEAMRDIIKEELSKK